MFIVDD